MIPWLPPEPIFPAPETALTEPNGLLAAGGDLTPERLLAAYSRGIFPWFSHGDPILWWSPDPRMVMHPTDLRISRAFAKVLRNRTYEIRIDTAFAEVMAACAEPRDGQNGTWISSEMQAAYRQLHALGYAHSIETWINNHLAGGLYGVAVGRAFFGESMFSHHKDASKIALAHLCALLQDKGFGIIDCQMETSHLASLGAHPIPRSEFAARLAELVPVASEVGPWSAATVGQYYRSPIPKAGRSS